MMLDIFPPYFGFEEALLREKRTEKARCICHTRHSTCSHVDLVVLGVSQHSSLSVLFSVAPPNKCRFGHGKRRVTSIRPPIPGWSMCDTKKGRFFAHFFGRYPLHDVGPYLSMMSPHFAMIGCHPR